MERAGAVLSDRVEMTDIVFTLNVLFLDGTAPPAPYPLEGRDPTDDSLGCAGF